MIFGRSLIEISSKFLENLTFLWVAYNACDAAYNEEIGFKILIGLVFILIKSLTIDRLFLNKNLLLFKEPNKFDTAGYLVFLIF